MTFTIQVLSARLDEAKHELEKFARKAKRYGVDWSYSIGDLYEAEVRIVVAEIDPLTGMTCGVPKTVTRTFRDVTITGEKPVVGDYEFLASIELGGDAGNIVDMVPGAEVPAEYRHTDNRCEHCHNDRARKHVFVARNRADGSLVQVGRTCLRDFLGTDDPNYVISKFKFFRTFKEWSERDEFGASFGFAASVYTALAVTSTCIRLFGWCSKGMAYNDESLTPTASYYELYMTREDLLKDHELVIKKKIQAAFNDEQDYQQAAKIRAWIAGVTPGPNDDYLHNLQVVLGQDLFTQEKRIGLICSAVSAYHRAMEIELKRAKEREKNADSVHVGDIKERIKKMKVRLESHRNMGDNGWGETSLFKFRDEDGNVLTWLTDAYLDTEIGEELLIDGTVKVHKEFNGVQETQLTRVKIH